MSVKNKQDRCDACRGAGFIFYIDSPMPGKFGEMKRRKCGKCNGAGQIPKEQSK